MVAPGIGCTEGKVANTNRKGTRALHSGERGRLATTANEQRQLGTASVGRIPSSLGDASVVSQADRSVAHQDARTRKNTEFTTTRSEGRVATLSLSFR